MPKDLPMSVTQITRNLEQFIRYAKQELRMKPQDALSDFITIMISRGRHNSEFFHTDSVEAIQLLNICASKNTETRQNLIIALKDICHKYANELSASDVLNEDALPAIRIAQFQNQTIEQAPHRILYRADLPKLVYESYESRCVLYLCIRIFNPKIEFVGDFANCVLQRAIMNEILRSIPFTHPTSITFKTSDHSFFGPDNREVFLSSIAKARSLTLDGARLDLWTSSDFEQFINKIRLNPNLKELSLVNTQLDKCCKAPVKLPYVLELFSLDQLDVLKIQDNRLNALPSRQWAKLQKAIDESPIDLICLDTCRHVHTGKKGSIRMFAANDANDKVLTRRENSASSQLS